MSGSTREGPTRSAAERLRDLTPEIAAAYEAAVRAEVTAAEQLSRDAVINSLPRLLAAIAVVADSPTAPTPVDLLGLEHGKARADQTSYSLLDVWNEHRLLKRLIKGALRRPPALPQPVEDTVMDSLDRALAASAAEFARRRFGDAARAQERYTGAELERERTTRERLVSAISHDLRTPLSAARMSAYLVARRAEDQDAVRKNASRIADNLDRADAMLRDLLDVSRISAGQELPLELENRDLFSVVTNALTELSSVHGDRFVLRGDASLPGVWSSAALRRIIANLCNNAAQYGSADEPISVRIERQGETAVLRVHNQGQPIPAEEMARLFEPFRQRQGASQRRHTGWGLGLTLVKGLTESHGGHVVAESEANTGTTFTVTLPLDARHARAARDATAPRSGDER